MHEQKVISSESDDYRRLLGARLRERRSYLGFNQEEVANALDMPRKALSDIESGQREVADNELLSLAKLYRQSISQFLDDTTAAPLPADVTHLARQAASISEQDREELSRFADYLRKLSHDKEA